MSDNVISSNRGNGIELTGAARLFAMVNMSYQNGGFDMKCGSGSEFDTFGDNFIQAVSTVGCAIGKSVFF